ncbi:hypothetical protein GCM10010174_80030 [Kutzneria viridogrisea]|uniref:Carrier domain-containing protein n=2 Tax=Kutzneria TaxID=43356 RepID=W5WBP4_9PSEU|nr:phosphopantetheine-binding protein [Kutzneria albida]AHH98165.1 hypothetical protein KALB_4803 [Kutzneria albida DSM 43870]MBA8924151.1 aryl carrier-like protein [Kutzneria viridogrisea]
MSEGAEELRRQLAELLEVEPQSIGDDDPLTDHGLDSIRVMALIESWHERGLSLSFAQLVEEPTVAAWAAALAAAKQG